MKGKKIVRRENKVMPKSEKAFSLKRSLNSGAGITLIALVITIIVMLILAGISLNAVIGDNGIITQAQNATYMQSVAVLEEYLNNFYVEHYEDMKDADSKVLTMINLEPSWFYIPANEGIGGLRYVVDADGHALYLIKKSGLPEDIRSQIKGGDAGEGEYADYVNLNDVYGVTENLQVYYCSSGTDSIMGVTTDELNADNPLREVFNKDDNSAFYNLLSNFDIADASGNKDGILTAEELKAVTQLTINSSSGITDFSEFYNLSSLKELTIDSVNLNNVAGIENCPQLNYVYFKSSTVADYSNLSNVRKLKYLYLYNVDDNELNKLCTGIKDAELGSLEYLAVSGNTYRISDTNITSISSNKSSKTITNLTPLSTLSDTTKKAIKYLSIQCNNIEGDLSALSGYTNLILLRCEYNNITSLAGMENMNNLVYLCGVGNTLGTLESGSGEDVETGIAIASLANKTKLQQVNLENNINLANVSYFENDTAIRYLYLGGCSNTMSVQGISDIILACGSNYSLPVKFLTGTVYNVAEYYTPSAVTYEELYSDLYENEFITHLNLEGCTRLNNEQFNTILKSMPNLKFLTLKDNPTLTSIDFISDDGATKLIELDLRNTGVKGENSLTNLNTYASELKTLRVSDGSDFKSIVSTINRLRVGADKTYWYGNSDKSGSMSGLNCSSIEVFKCLEKLEDLEYLYVAQWSGCIGSSNDIVRLENTNLKKAYISGVLANIYLPASITEVFMSNCGVPIMAENSNSLTNLSILYPLIEMNLKDEFFESLKNATNIKYLTLQQLVNLGVRKLSDCIKYNLPNVITLNLNGLTPNNPRNSLVSLEGIERLPNLQELSIDYTNDSLNISAIKNCSKLEIVLLRYCKINSLSGIEGLTNLKILNIKNNNITALKPLENLKNLTSLNLQNNAIADTSSYIDTDGSTKTYRNLDILAGLHTSRGGKLSSLYLAGNDNIIDFSPVSNLSWSNKSGF